MSSNIQDLNLSFLAKEYRNKGKALKGYNALRRLINEGNSDTVAYLLRYHLHQPINTEYEVEFRDNMDYLIRYYSIIEVALISGYIKQPLDKKLQDEIDFVLGNDAVKPFYEEYYKLLLPQLLYYTTNKKLEKNYQNTNDELSLFEEFLLLDRFVQEDKDILTFLWFLDDGGTQDKDGIEYHIYSVIDLLKNKEQLKMRIKKKNKIDVLDSAFRGLIKYINFISSFKKLLDKTKTPILQSAFWHYNSYWFNLLKQKFSNVISKAFDNLNSLVLDINIEEFNNSYSDANSDIYLNHSEEPKEKTYSSWKEESHLSIDEALNNIISILNDNYEQPLNQHFIIIKNGLENI